MAELEKLDTIAARINEEHRACETAANAALTHAMSAGELLMEAKGQLSPGAFGPWLTENFARSDRTARAYMRVYSHREELKIELRKAKEHLRHKRDVIQDCIRQPGFEV
jgi:hypothetical protein